MEIIAAASLIQLANHFRGTQVLSRPQPKIREFAEPLVDLKDIKGQESAKRALEVAAAGGHNLLLVGPPGAGKSMLAARLPTHSSAAHPGGVARSVDDRLGRRRDRRRRARPTAVRSARRIIRRACRPWSAAGLRARPGEISLAHHGVLFLDELPEFQAHALDALRQPLETGEVAIARANHRVTYPARFMLVAAMNPCRCGRAERARLYLQARADARDARPITRRGFPGRSSTASICTSRCRRSPPPISSCRRPRREAREVAERVAARPRACRRERYAAIGLRTSAPMPLRKGPCSKRLRAPDAAGLALLRDAADAMRLSARGYHRVLRVARTLADLDGAERLGRVHLAEALSYRMLADEIRRAA